MNSIFILIFALSMLAGACKKSETPDPLSTLPTATHTGANTFGCLIDGEAFIASGKPLRGLDGNGVVAIPYINTAWYVDGTNGNKHIALQFDFNSNPSVPGTFSMTRWEPYRGHYFYYPDGTVPTGSTEYITDTVHVGTVTITNYTSTLVAGTFAFDAMNGDGKVAHITNGRFDIAF